MPSDMTRFRFELASRWLRHREAGDVLPWRAACQVGLTALLVGGGTAVAASAAAGQCEAPHDRVVTSMDGGNVVVCNRWYRAVFHEAGGTLYRVVLESDQDSSIEVLSESALLIRQRVRGDSVHTVELVPVEFTLEEEHDFYVRLSALFRSVDSVEPLIVQRTYEFTRSPQFYEQVAIAGPATMQLEGGPPSESSKVGGVGLEHLVWRIRADERLRPFASSEDLLVRHPTGRLGGYDLVLHGQAMETEFRDGPPIERQIIAQGRFKATDSAAVIEAGNVLLINTMFALTNADLQPARSLHRVVPEYQFYPGFGLRTRGWTQQRNRGFTFVNWNVYEIANEFIPIQNRADEDALIRLSMHLEERMRIDNGWPRTGRFSRFYPEGDRFTAHSRSFPPLAYLWAHLTVKLINGEWTHVGGDADLFYHRLQSLFRFFDPGSDVHFADTLSAVNAPYVAYSAAVKEIDATGAPIRGIFNVHADALQFMWIMAEASEFYGDLERAEQWAALVDRFHVGSKELFRRLYPARDGDQIYTGLLQYSLSQSDYFPIGYSMKSFNGMVVGYVSNAEYELAFVDAVERAVHLPYPQRQLRLHWGSSAIVGRLVRALPIALSTAGDTVSMSRSASSASLGELLIIERLLEDSTTRPGVRRWHDVDKLIFVEGGAWIVASNASFVSDWIPGHWEELSADSVPAAWAYGATLRTNGHQGERWTVARRGQQFLVLANFAMPGGEIELATPVRGYTVSKRIYTDGLWMEPEVIERVAVPASDQQGITRIALPALAPKALLQVTLFSVEALRWLLPIR